VHVFKIYAFSHIAEEHQRCTSGDLTFQVIKIKSNKTWNKIRTAQTSENWGESLLFLYGWFKCEITNTYCKTTACLFTHCKTKTGSTEQWKLLFTLFCL